MIPIPEGWTATQLARAIVLVHPEGEEVATIHYRERVRPLRRLGAIVDEILAATPGFAVARLGAPERLVTHEGEHAALVTIAGTQDGAVAQRVLGVVFGDDFFAAVGGLSLRPERFAELAALVRKLTRKDRQLLGARRRRFEYAPPPGWEPYVRDLVVDWFPPGFPRDRSVLRVHPAYPCALTRGLKLDSPLPPRPVATVAGLTGWAHRLQAGDQTREVVTLKDARFHYVVELTSPSADHAPALEAVVASVVPIPSGAGRDDPSDVLAYWLN